MAPVDTKKTDRREVHFATMDELAAEVGRIEEAEARGALRAMGNWSAGQNLDHLARFMGCSLDGFAGEMSLGVRIFGKVLRLAMGKKLFQKPPPAGYKLPVGTEFLPRDGVSVADGAAALRAQIARVQAGEEFVPKSPFLGPMGRDEWTQMHLRHAELHLSFVGIEAEPG